jgi:hypothetical protein
MGEIGALLLVVLTLPYPGSDPALRAYRDGRTAVRDLECDRVPQVEAHKLHPARVPEPAPRGDAFMQYEAMVCSRRLLPWGEHPARDELILDNLSTSIAGLVQPALGLGDKDTVWTVDAFYPDVDVTARIVGAARAELAQRGVNVSNTVPLLAAGDLLVLRRLDVKQAMPVACSRFQAEGSLGEHDAFIGLALVDGHESELHSGICQNGTWRWLR